MGLFKLIDTCLSAFEAGAVLKSEKEQKILNGVVFTCRHFMDEGKNVTYIYHKENGDYECFCSNCEQELDLNSVMVIGLEEIVTENNKDLFNIEKGKYNYFQDGNWYEKDLDKKDEYFAWLFEMEDKIINENIRRNKELRSDLSGIKIERQ